MRVLGSELYATQGSQNVSEITQSPLKRSSWLRMGLVRLRQLNWAYQGAMILMAADSKVCMGLASVICKL
jgi:hypothetical protein